ncbi:hypothetical protein DAPPUDRAFT_117198 [Daphnia pulex]|uniref:Uncharacterized protein n=1 Tax=Daphnia pulex TaxID=6669 RepID=E9HRV3_DAPPU|nr:hypothetical protein DAPPUDRAFT_117198 [Daphnia pulex]|eukprot:EFX65511.1 hypothetical protein DAPPUDRAFT_117198 [Daphnia pulex]
MTITIIPARINLAHVWSAVICLPKLRKHRGAFLRVAKKLNPIDRTTQCYNSQQEDPTRLKLFRLNKKMLLVNVSGLAGNLHNARLASSVTQRSQINCTHAADDFLKQKTKDSDRSKLGDWPKRRRRLRSDKEPNLSRHNVRLVDRQQGLTRYKS